MAGKAGGGIPLPEADKAAKQSAAQKKKLDRSINKAMRLISWIVGLVFAISPLIVCGLGMLLNFGNTEIVDRYNAFIDSFFSSGSFLWIAISLLISSFTELLLQGFKSGISKERKIKYTALILGFILLVGLGIILYFANIATPFNKTAMLVFSFVGFILFAVCSWIVSFRISKGG